MHYYFILQNHYQLFGYWDGYLVIWLFIGIDKKH